jgi:murein DD-endopeptidase MepM/ murein hydrolase activator NlpD
VTRLAALAAEDGERSQPDDDVMHRRPRPTPSATPRWGRSVRRLVLVVLALVVTTAIAPPATRADELTDALAREKALEKQIREQRRKVARLDSMQADLRAQIRATSAALREVNADLARVKRNIVTTEQRIDTIRAAYIDLSREIDVQSRLIERTIRSQWRRGVELEERKAMLGERIRSSYATRQTSLLETFLSGDSFTDVLTEAAYFLDVGEQDKALAQEITRRSMGLEADRRLLDLSRAQAVGLRVEKEQQKDALDAALADLRVAKKQLQKLERETARALASQRADFARMARNETAMRKTLASRVRAQRSLENRIADILAAQSARGNIPSQYNGSLSWPMAGQISQEYGCTGFGWEPPRGGCAHFHSGIDIAAPMYTTIRAAGAGTVLFAGPNPYDPYPKAWIVIIAHSQSLVTWYGHVDNSAKPPRVRAGQTVRKGQIIAFNGLTGRTTGPHLHWMVEFNDDFVNPRLFV